MKALNPKHIVQEPSEIIKELPDESNREAIEQMLGHAYEFFLTQCAGQTVTAETGNTPVEQRSEHA